MLLLIVLDSIFYGIVHLWVVLANQEIVSKSQNNHQNNNDQRAHKASNNMLQYKRRNNYSDHSKDIKPCILHLK